VCSSFEGIDFEGNFTPLYHITGYIREIIKDDMLKPARPSRGPKGICLTRSKYFTHGGTGHGSAPRIILNREALLQDGYKIYPLDEWTLARPENSPKPGSSSYNIDKMKAIHPETRDKWVNKEVIKKYHMGKSQFPALKAGKRPISHNIEGLPNDKRRGLEVEYEERILTEVKNLGKYIYAFNFATEDQYTQKRWSGEPSYKETIDLYKAKYPHIKVLIGLTRFKEV
jgi:hypothetical protein